VYNSDSCGDGCSKSCADWLLRSMRHMFTRSPVVAERLNLLTTGRSVINSLFIFTPSVTARESGGETWRL